MPTVSALVRRSTLLVGWGLLVASAAAAKVPSRATSTIGNIMQLGTRTPDGVADPRCTKTITVRDAAGNRLYGVTVEIDFTNCYASEIRIAAAVATYNQSVDCGTHTVSAVTNGSGVASFQVVGASNVTTSAAAGAGEGCASVTAHGIFLGNLSVATPDLNGAGDPTAAGVDGQDTLIFNGNRWGGGGLYRARANLAANPGHPSGQAIDGQDTLVFYGYRWGRGIGGPDSSALGFCP